MAETDYQALAKTQLAAEADRRRQADIDARANTLRQAREREALHAALKKKHNLPNHASPRQIADCEIAFEQGFKDFVVSRYASGARGLHVFDPEHANFLNPDGSPDTQRLAEMIALREKLRVQFEKSWPPADLVDRVMQGATDGTTQHYGHTTGAAA